MGANRPGILRFIPGLTLFIFLGPVAAGLLGTLLPAFGYLPALGGETFSLSPWKDMAAYPGIQDAVLRSLYTGIIATVISFCLVTGFIAANHDTVWFDRARALMSPLLAMPHAALAMGLAFLLTPSGWMVRIISPWATGFERPPDFAMAPDPYGWGLILALVIKEVPFLFLMMMGALVQVPEKQSMRIARSLGYSKMSGWLKTVLPQIYPQIRLPVYAVLAFSVSVVDVAIILTTTPTPTLSILLLRWMNDPDITLYFQAAAGACLQGGLVILALSLWGAAERIATFLNRLWIRSGGRDIPLLIKGSIQSGFWIITGTGIAGLLGLAIWSIAKRWRFPDALPSHWGFETWAKRIEHVSDPFQTTLILGVAAATIATILVLLCLESEQRTGRHTGNRALWLLYIPLIIPQVAFLFGAQVLMVMGGIDGHWPGLIWAHLLFVLPYVFLSLSDPYRALDPRFSRSAQCLGAGPWRIFWRIKLPMLLHPILIAFAVGFAVSVGEYLPTIFAGAGRLTTLTVEAVALSGGGDRRITGILVVLQALLPFIFFTLAAVIPWGLHAMIFRSGRHKISQGTSA